MSKKQSENEKLENQKNEILEENKENNIIDLSEAKRKILKKNIALEKEESNQEAKEILEELKEEIKAYLKIAKEYTYEDFEFFNVENNLKRNALEYCEEIKQINIEVYKEALKIYHEFKIQIQDIKEEIKNNLVDMYKAKNIMLVNKLKNSKKSNKEIAEELFKEAINAVENDLEKYNNLTYEEFDKTNFGINTIENYSKSMQIISLFNLDTYIQAKNKHSEIIEKLYKISKEKKELFEKTKSITSKHKNIIDRFKYNYNDEIYKQKVINNLNELRNLIKEFKELEEEYDEAEIETEFELEEFTARINLNEIIDIQVLQLKEEKESLQSEIEGYILNLEQNSENLTIKTDYLKTIEKLDKLIEKLDLKRKGKIAEKEKEEDNISSNNIIDIKSYKKKTEDFSSPEIE